MQNIAYRAETDNQINFCKEILEIVECYAKIGFTRCNHFANKEMVESIIVSSFFKERITELR